MRIAVTHEDGFVFRHFGHTAQFMIYDTEQGRVLSSCLLETAGGGHGALAGLLAREQVQALICGGIGSGARTALQEQGIAVYGGVTGDTDEAVEAFLAGVLEYDPHACCAHHGGCGGCSHHE